MQLDNHGITSAIQLTPTNQYYMKSWLILTLILTKILVSCGNKEIKISIKNKSKDPINEMTVFVQSKQFKIDKTKGNGYSTINIKRNDITLNTHDFRIESTLTLRDGKKNRGFYFSDISGIPNSEYSIEVYDSISVIK